MKSLTPMHSWLNIMQRSVTILLSLLSIIYSSTAISSSSPIGNFRISPLILPLGAVNIETDIVISKYYTIAPMYTYWNFKATSDLSANISGYGIRVDFHPRRVFRDGLLYGAFLKRWDLDAEYPDDSSTLVTRKMSIDTFGITAGYRWMWHSFNITAEFGYRFLIFNDFNLTLETDGADKIRIKDINALGGAVTDVTFGWAF